MNCHGQRQLHALRVDLHWCGPVMHLVMMEMLQVISAYAHEDDVLHGHLAALDAPADILPAGNTSIILAAPDTRFDTPTPLLLTAGSCFQPGAAGPACHPVCVFVPSSCFMPCCVRLHAVLRVCSRHAACVSVLWDRLDCVSIRKFHAQKQCLTVHQPARLWTCRALA